ncbi:ribosome recycling factor [Alphaproteobacteria bacterium]|nr:ribosome recycling factor [Alphaproteobacteria bacterium]
MDDENNIPLNSEEGYSPEAIANLERAIEEFAETMLEIKSEDANIKVFESLQITMNGRKRRIGDLANVESPDDPMKIQLMVYNKEHIEEVLEFIKENGFPSKNEEGSQFINVRVPKPSRMQLEEIGDDVNRRTNAVGSRLMKIKTNTGLRIRAATEKEFIDQRIAGIATKKIDLHLERCTKEIRIIGLMKRKKILGSFFKVVERDDADLLKVIAKRVKLEEQRIENQNQLRIQAEALANQAQEPQLTNQEQTNVAAS